MQFLIINESISQYTVTPALRGGLARSLRERLYKLRLYGRTGCPRKAGMTGFCVFTYGLINKSPLYAPQTRRGQTPAYAGVGIHFDWVAG